MVVIKELSGRVLERCSDGRVKVVVWEGFM